MTTQKKLVYAYIVALCNKLGSREFSRQELLDHCLIEFRYRHPNISHPSQTISRLLQELRDENRLTFHPTNNGSYTLHIDLLEIEKRDIEANSIDPNATLPNVSTQEKREKREYLIEIYVRNAKWVKDAISKYDRLCMLDGCGNHFNKPDGSPYIEVHHIVPLCNGGGDNIGNLSVLCAHHHKKAHFANDEQRRELRDSLLSIVKNYS